MPRQFGITSRPALRGNNERLTGSHGAEQTRAKLHLVADNSPADPSSRLPNSPSFYLEPFIPHRYDYGAALLWLGLICGPWIIVLGLVFAYMAFIA